MTFREVCGVGGVDSFLLFSGWGNFSILFCFLMEEENFSEKKFYKHKNFWLGAGAAILLFAVFSLAGEVFEENLFLKDFRSAFKAAIGDVFGSTEEKLIYEVDLKTGEAKDLSNLSENREIPDQKLPNKDASLASVQNLVFSKNEKEDVSTKTKEEVLPKLESDGKSGQKNISPPEKNLTAIKECDFSFAGNGDKRISFNELAWMGGLNSASDEWMEIKNNSGAEIYLAGWQIKNQSEKIKIIFEEEDKISANGFLLLERTDDDSVLGVAADKIYVGAMSNESEWLKLFDRECNLVDEVNASWGWGNFGGENATKKTLERNKNDFHWHTSNNSGGTPRAENSVPVLVSGSGGGGQSDPLEENSSQAPQGPVSSSTPQNNPPESNPDQSAATILISEVMAGSSVSADDEFVEIYNYGSQAVNLTGWTIKKKSSSGNESSLVAASRLEGRVVQPGKYLLLTREGGYAGVVAGDVTWPASYALAYTNNTVTIYNASGGVVDQVTWAEIPKDKSYSRTSLDIEAGFGVVDTPSPTNSQ